MVSSVKNQVFIVDGNNSYIEIHKYDRVSLKDGFVGIVNSIGPETAIISKSVCDFREVPVVWDSSKGKNLLHRKANETFLMDNATGECYGQLGLACSFKYKEGTAEEKKYYGDIGDIVHLSVLSVKTISLAGYDKAKATTSKSYITIVGKEGPVGINPLEYFIDEVSKIKPYTALVEGETYGNVRFVTSSK